ncbi:B12-binding domain-containing radical SAM protein [Patescibacteria group bacterium]
MTGLNIYDKKIYKTFDKNSRIQNRKEVKMTHSLAELIKFIHSKSSLVQKTPRILLTSVCKPFDDPSNPIELFHNQVTRMQGPYGLFSIRGHNPSANLIILGANIESSVTVVDFPSIQRFIWEVLKGYEFIGISAIVPNIEKTKVMVDIIKKYSPKTKIIIGGHATTVPTIREELGLRKNYDFIILGEGISQLRKILGEPKLEFPPINHPPVPSAHKCSIAGIPYASSTGVVLVGAGCEKGCDFCSTSHFFKKKYISLLKTGKHIFDICLKGKKKYGFTNFFLLDENLLNKQMERVRELLKLIKENNEPFTFGIFASADTIKRVGVKFLVELGVNFVWIGAESYKQDVYGKNKDIDMHSLIKELRQHGIMVLASMVLFQNWHTKEDIPKEIDYAISLNATWTQFMSFGAYHHTKLGKTVEILEDLLYSFRHGQRGIWHKHNEFTPKESGWLLDEAFKKEYEALGPSIIRMVETRLDGYKFIKEKYKNDKWMMIRAEQMKKDCERLLPLVRASLPYLLDERMRNWAKGVIHNYHNIIGPETLKQKISTQFARLLALKRYWQLQLFPKSRISQPKTSTYKFNQ